MPTASISSDPVATGTRTDLAPADIWSPFDLRETPGNHFTRLQSKCLPRQNGVACCPKIDTDARTNLCDGGRHDAFLSCAGNLLSVVEGICELILCR